MFCLYKSGLGTDFPLPLIDPSSDSGSQECFAISMSVGNGLACICNSPLGCLADSDYVHWSTELVNSYLSTFFATVQILACFRCMQLELSGDLHKIDTTASVWEEHTFQILTQCFDSSGAALKRGFCLSRHHLHRMLLW